MGKLIDLTGKQFGKLTVIERAEDHIFPNGKRGVTWKCLCSCKADLPENEKKYTYVLGENLKKGYEKEEKDVKEQKNYDAGYDIGNNSVNSSDVEIKEVQTESLDNKKNKNRISLSEALTQLKEEEGFDLVAELEAINKLFEKYNSKL